MDKIATKTKILAWAVIGDKEKINLDLCDFSPDQVAALDRLLRAEGENKVELTIEPEQKKLQIAPIVSTVRLVSLSCRTKGQKLTVSGFKSPDERATAIKRLSAADTPIMVTIVELQTGMLDQPQKDAAPERTLLDGETTKDTKGTKETFEVAPGLRAQETREEHPIKLKGLKGCRAIISVLHDADGWRAGWAIQLGNLANEQDPEATLRATTQIMAVSAAAEAGIWWLDNVELPGKADAKRALAKRRESIIEQIKAWLADQPGMTEPFEEDTEPDEEAETADEFHEEPVE